MRFIFLILLLPISVFHPANGNLLADGEWLCDNLKVTLVYPDKPTKSFGHEPIRIKKYFETALIKRNGKEDIVLRVSEQDNYSGISFKAREGFKSLWLMNDKFIFSIATLADTSIVYGSCKVIE